MERKDSSNSKSGSQQGGSRQGSQQGNSRGGSQGGAPERKRDENGRFISSDKDSSSSRGSRKESDSGRNSR